MRSYMDNIISKGFPETSTEGVQRAYDLIQPNDPTAVSESVYDKVMQHLTESASAQLTDRYDGVPVTEVHTQPVSEITDKFGIDIDINILLANFEGFGGGPEKRDWDDFEPKRMACINLVHSADEKVIEVGRKTFKEIHTQITTATAAGILFLAYHLQTENGERIFEDIPPELRNDEDMLEYDQIDSSPMSTIYTGTAPREFSFNYNDPAGTRKLAISYSYLACSYLRLYRKPAEDYIKIGRHLKEKFTKFYSFDLAVLDARPSLDAVKLIKIHLERPRNMNTFYQILWAGETTRRTHVPLKNFLYRNHVSYAGLHCIPLFLRCMELLHLSATQLAKVLYTVSNERKLDAIVSVMNDLMGETRNHERQMWRFARIFNNDFLSSLRTKYCKRITLSFAFILLAKDPSTSNDILKISELQDVGRFDGASALLDALRALAILTHVGSDNL
ncbi:hypothetical protein Cni_G08557 [Canna indica]|uniref:Nucleoprotein n=1 Tax=Canna indica TaxID=4628 RepID=A0AAQ3K6A2_9LILI|nr:hypothetical protein Cni_G08557 [Canna indica]